MKEEKAKSVDNGIADGARADVMRQVAGIMRGLGETVGSENMIKVAENVSEKYRIENPNGWQTLGQLGVSNSVPLALGSVAYMMLPPNEKQLLSNVGHGATIYDLLTYPTVENFAAKNEHKDYGIKDIGKELLYTGLAAEGARKLTPYVDKANEYLSDAVKEYAIERIVRGAGEKVVAPVAKKIIDKGVYPVLKGIGDTLADNAVKDEELSNFLEEHPEAYAYVMRGVKG